MTFCLTGVLGLKNFSQSAVIAATRDELPELVAVGGAAWVTAVAGPANWPAPGRTPRSRPGW